MNYFTNTASLLLFSVTIFFLSCSQAEKETLPPAPSSVEAVSKVLMNKNFKVNKTGQYGMVLSNEPADIEWIDTTGKADNLTNRLINELGNWQLTFLNDTACTVISKGKEYIATWSVDNQHEEDQKPGIRLRLNYVDPEFSFGNEPSAVTYSYVVLGMDEKRLLLELPRELNRRKLISLLQSN